MLTDKILNKKKTLIFTSAALLIIAAVIISVCVGLLSNSDTQENESTTVNNGTQTEVLTGDSTFLVVITNESNEIVMPMLADFKIYSCQLVITPLSFNTVTSNGKTYSETYSYGGINLLQSAVEEVRNINIDRYAVINKAGFNRLTELMGEVVLYVDEDFTYDTSDKTYTVTKGENSMGSDMLFTYVSILANRTDGENAATQAICTIVNSYIENVDLSDTQELFGSITNCFTTDVTISDYYTAKSDIEYLLSNGFKCIISNDVA